MKLEDVLLLDFNAEHAEQASLESLERMDDTTEDVSKPKTTLAVIPQATHQRKMVSCPRSDHSDDEDMPVPSERAEIQNPA